MFIILSPPLSTLHIHPSTPTNSIKATICNSPHSTLNHPIPSHCLYSTSVITATSDSLNALSPSKEENDSRLQQTMPNKNKRFKSQSLVIDKFESVAPVKLTKQQKRDLKRHNKSETAHAVNSTNLTGSSTASNDVTATAEPVKLTKQQKRDQKRNAQVQAGARNTHASSRISHQTSHTHPHPTTSVYKRKTTYPPLYLTDDLISSFTIPHDRFLNENDSSYNSVLASAYQGFKHSPTDTFSTSFHDKFERAMVGLEAEGKYQYDVTQPAGLGTKTAMTYVTRCVVGEPGTTYKYLGLRMFSIPWTPGSVGSSEHSVEIRRLNQEMINRSGVLLAESNEASGSCQFNLTLINR